MELDTSFLAALSEAPSVATACGPVVNLVRGWLGQRARTDLCPDSHLLVTAPGKRVSDLRCLLVSHMDEIGGCVLGQRDDASYDTRWWGCHPERYAAADLQAMDYLAEHAGEAFAVAADLVGDEDPPVPILRGDGIRPYRTVWTFREAARADGDWVEGKALDPRATVFAVLSALLQVNDPAVGVLLVMAEECAVDMARKAVTMLHREARSLRLIVNADVPAAQNLCDADPAKPAIRVFEGRGMVDPWFGIRVADRLTRAGLAFHLTAARTGSQTPLFSPLAPTISVALPGEGVHTARARMSLTGVRRCIELLCALAELSGEDIAAA